MDTVPTEILGEIIDALYEPPPPTVLRNTSPLDLDKDPLLANLRNVRLVCKAFKATADKMFGSIYFSSICVVLQKDSIQRALKISTSSVLNQYVSVVQVLTFRFLNFNATQEIFSMIIAREKRAKGTYLNHPDVSKEFTRGRVASARKYYKECCEQQEEMLQSSSHIAQLAQIFENTKATLKTVSVSGRLPDHTMRPITRKIGISANPQHTPEQASTQTAQDVLQAIYWSRVQLCGLDFQYMGISFLRLPERKDYLHAIGVEHLHMLDVMFRPDTDDIYDEAAGHIGSLHFLLTSLPNLSDLSVRFIGRLSEGATCADLFGPRVPNLKLEYLTLGGFSFGLRDLTRFLYRHHKTLRSLRLEDMKVRGGKWRGVFSWLRERLALSKFSFHKLQDRREMLHMENAALERWVTRASPHMDWDTMRDEILESLKLADAMDVDNAAAAVAADAAAAVNLPDPAALLHAMHEMGMLPPPLGAVPAAFPWDFDGGDEGFAGVFPEALIPPYLGLADIAMDGEMDGGEEEGEEEEDDQTSEEEEAFDPKNTVDMDLDQEEVWETEDESGRSDVSSFAESNLIGG